MQIAVSLQLRCPSLPFGEGGTLYAHCDYDVHYPIPHVCVCVGDGEKNIRTCTNMYTCVYIDQRSFRNSPEAPVILFTVKKCLGDIVHFQCVMELL